jgi:hypothetical protein
MKSEFLKLAGVKSEKAFYKKYPTEAAFFKAHPEANKKINKAQNFGNLNDKNNNGIPDFLENMNSMNDPRFGQTANYANIQGYGYTPQVSGVGGNLQTAGLAKLPNQLPVGKSFTAKELMGNSGQKKPDSGAMNMVGKGLGFINDIRQLDQESKAAKEQTKKLETWADVSDVVLRAKRSNDAVPRPQNQWVRPDDKRFIANTDQLYNIQGRGSDILTGQNGSFIGGNPTEIQNTYAPDNTLYDNLEYEPLQDEEQVKAYQTGGGFGEWFGKMNGALGGSSTGGFMGNFGVSSPFAGMISGSNNSAEGKKWGKIGSMFGPGVGLLTEQIATAFDKNPGRQRSAMNRMDFNNRLMGQVDGANNITTGIQGMGVAQDGIELSAYEEGGYMNPEYNPQVIAMFGDHNADDFADYANKFRAGGHLKEYTAPSERAMQTYAMGGQLQTHWGGEVNTIAKNPYLPGSGEIGMLSGASHNNGGIGISYTSGEDGYEGVAANGANMGAQVEAETGEPIIEMAEGGSMGSNTSAVIFGNIPFTKKVAQATGDEALIKLAKEKDGKTYKKLIADLAAPQKRAEQTKVKASKIANDADQTKWGALDLKTAEMMKYGGDQTQKDYADLIMKLANLQNATQEVKKEQSYLKGKNISAEALGKGKIETDYDPITKDAELENPYAKHGAYLRKAQTGFVEGLGVDSEGYDPYAYTASNIVANNKPLRTFSMGDYGDAWKRSIYPEGVFLDSMRDDVNPDEEAGIYDDYMVIDQTPNNNGSYVQTYPKGNIWEYIANGNQRRVNANGEFYQTEYRSSVDPNFWWSDKESKDEEDARIAKEAAANNKNKSVEKDKQVATTTPAATSSNTTGTPTSTNDKDYVSKYGITPWKGNVGKKYGKATASSFSTKQWDEVADKLGFKGKGNKEFQEFLLNNPESAPLIKARHQNLYGKDPWVDPEHFGAGWAADQLLLPKAAEIPTDTTTKQTTEAPKDTNVIPYKRNKLGDFANIISQFFQNDNLPDLDPRQLTKEYMTIAQNTPYPVQAQQYAPELDPMYRVSYEDIMNQNTADFRDVERQLGNNPAALANLLANKYKANQAVKGEEFRANQAIEQQVFGGNRAKINQARAINMQLLADQRDKQLQGEATTNKINQEAIGSIGDKYLQHEARNNEYRVKRNLFPNFRYGETGNIYNQGYTQLNIPQMYGNKASLIQVPVYGPDGKTITGYELKPYDPSANGGVGTPPLRPTAKNGKSIVKNAKNSSVVKAFKNL